MTAVLPAELAAAFNCSEQTMTLWDGAELFYRHWRPAVPSQKAILLFHRGHEHSGRFSEVVRELALADFHVFAWDARGHGRSPGERGYAPNFAALVKDIETFARFISQTYGLQFENMTAVGHSVGAVAVAAWVHDYAPPIRAMVLVTPAFRVKLYVPFALSALRLRMKFGGVSFIKSYVKAGMLTHDPRQAEAYRADPLISRQIATNILIDLYDTATRLIHDAGAIQVPTLILSAGADWVVKNGAQREFFERLGSPTKQLEAFPGLYHDLLHEEHRAGPIGKLRDFIVRAFERPAFVPNLLDADRQGYTHREYERLARPLPRLSPRRLSFAIQKLGMRTICRLSEGIRLGWRTGFNSGQSLDYIYRNQPRGFTPLGKLVDRIYLNSVGWTGIRHRKADLQAALREAIEEVRTRGREVRILDIATGGGRYLLEVLAATGTNDVSAVLRDLNSEAIELGVKTAAELKLPNVRFELGDAFDPIALAQVRPRPNTVISSGLYELIPENELVLRSLKGVSDVIEPDGLLIYTNQPWHPQIEMIARVLRNRNGRPWVMRRRTQAEMDQLVHRAGFEKVSMRIDPAGIFTVSLARRLRRDVGDEA